VSILLLVMAQFVSEPVAGAFMSTAGLAPGHESILDRQRRCQAHVAAGCIRDSDMLKCAEVLRP